LAFLTKYEETVNLVENPLVLNDEQIARHLQENFDMESALSLTKTNTENIRNTFIDLTINDEQLA